MSLQQALALLFAWKICFFLFLAYFFTIPQGLTDPV